MGTNAASFKAECFLGLKEKLDSRTATVGVIGLGYVGLPLVHTLHNAEFSVIGYDTDSSKIKKLSSGISYIQHIPLEVAQSLSLSTSFTPTDNFETLKQCDVLILCLPTPVGSHNEPDMSFVLSSAKRIASIMTKGTLVVLESTTYPGATDTDMVEVLNESGLTLGSDYFLAYSPEREDPGNVTMHTHEIPKLLGGVDASSGALAELLYRQGGFLNVVRVSSARVAECAKLLENTYRAVNIALVNELKTVFSSMHVNIWEVLDAAGTKPFGFQRFNPGPGIGGHCIPVDPFYLTWKAKETGAPCGFIELAALVNAKMPGVVVESVQGALNEVCKSVKGSKILLLGIAYKGNVDDIREAPALVIWENLLDLGADVKYHDPFVPVVCPTRKHPRLSGERSVGLDGSADCAGFDAVVLVTNHDRFEEFRFLRGFEGAVIDTRNAIPESLGITIIRA
ncbi:unnamed protein product [Chondrus crispus]|uniref:UDP-glucose/GDP-mannose dehydrogenase C-terminal domain-containing protein n=1 Tax=Chondrus crispus TaxID=2769 RepID=R7QBD6_CHOCR|nr:unnamed protein product [Chondrus crispus]CDF35827.1 unnamed protein product [Chondrus crispus]|eukprot:XP_005715646.1 unnamed protein product [Chondrus crispus]